MNKIAVYNQSGKTVGEVELSSAIFGVKVSLSLVKEAIKAQLANKRSSIASVKTRAEVRGGGRKPWKQKGTGRARQGSIRSPLWPGGGITFGPSSDRNWSIKINKKARQSALFMALSDKVADEKVIILEDLVFNELKTKEFVKWYEDFSSKVNGLGRKILVVLPKRNDAFVRVSKNLKFVKSIYANSLNVVDVVTADSLIILQDSLNIISKTFTK